jgi:molecular chaperone GrpE (heat shock protein)
VHRQHGGPKASCFCPHKDCKRSTGVGFSRRENLHEHLRRVHRDAGDDAKDEPEPEQLMAPGGPRKRRRAPQAEEKEKEDDESLQQEVKKLRRELQEKDDRLERLEQLVEKLHKGQQKQ